MAAAKKRERRKLMLCEFTTKNYKSIIDNKIELGRFNVFIGENGCGKTNILEAVAMAGAVLRGKLDVEELYARGIRAAKPAITFSSFVGIKQSKEINISLGFESESNKRHNVNLCLAVKEQSAVDVTWRDKVFLPQMKVPLKRGTAKVSELRVALKRSVPQEAIGAMASGEHLFNMLKDELSPDGMTKLANWIIGVTTRAELDSIMGDFVIYNINTMALRGMHSASRRAPLGIYGENLDLAMSSMTEAERDDLVKRARCISWLDGVVVDAGDELKYHGHKLGRSTSTLYFRDKFMPRRNNIFSAENANEGVLHVLFYLVLFASSKTPKIFGIDNIESALNPQLCRDIVKQLAELAKKHNKQALITTHNPAILDGLNLNDDEQRLFVVSRNDEGHTTTERVKVKPDTKEWKYKLSELWMRGHLGGIPRRF